MNEAERILINRIEERGFAHVAKRLRLVVGQPEARTYLDSLLVADLKRTRNGFPNDVFEIIMSLYQLQDFNNISLDTRGL